MKQKSGGGRKSGGGPILISKDNRAGGKESLLESSPGDAYYNNPNVSTSPGKLISLLPNMESVCTGSFDQICFPF